MHRDTAEPRAHSGVILQYVALYRLEDGRVGQADGTEMLCRMYLNHTEGHFLSPKVGVTVLTLVGSLTPLLGVKPPKKGILTSKIAL